MTDGLESASLRISEASAPWSCPASRISIKRAMRGSPSDKVLHRIDAGALPAYCGGPGNNNPATPPTIIEVTSPCTRHGTERWPNSPSSRRAIGSAMDNGARRRSDTPSASLLWWVSVRHGVNAKFLADMGEFCRVGEPAIRHHRAECR